MIDIIGEMLSMIDRLLVLLQSTKEERHRVHLGVVSWSPARFYVAGRIGCTSAVVRWARRGSAWAGLVGFLVETS